MAGKMYALIIDEELMNRIKAKLFEQENTTYGVNRMIEEMLRKQLSKEESEND